MTTTSHPTTTAVRTRIAPSPTGLPHFGLLMQAVLNVLIARQHDGAFVLRIEDTDRKRYNPVAEQAILDALSWADLTPDEGPHRPGQCGPYRQSERLPLYQQAAEALVNAGNAYYCFCSSERLSQLRDAQQKSGQLPMYDRHCRSLSVEEARQRTQTEPFVIRLKVPQDQTIVLQDAIRGDIGFQSNVVDDQVLLKSDGFPTYHLAVVVDDHTMDITHVVRGEEWLSSAPKHVLLYDMLQWQQPIFIHTPTLRNPDKSKLSKRHGHSSIEWYQQKGYLPQAVINFILSIIWTHPNEQEAFSLSDILPIFNITDIHITGPVVNLDKLNWLNGLYIRRLSDSELLTCLQPFVPSDCPEQQLAHIIPLIQDRLTTLSDFTELSSFFFRPIQVEPAILVKKSTPEEVKVQLSKTIDALSELADWQTNTIEQVIRELQESHNWSRKQYFMLVRYAVTGKSATPPLFETITVLSQDSTLQRLTSALSVVNSVAE